MEHDQRLVQDAVAYGRSLTSLAAASHTIAYISAGTPSASDRQPHGPRTAWYKLHFVYARSGCAGTSKSCSMMLQPLHAAETAWRKPLLQQYITVVQALPGHSARTA